MFQRDLKHSFRLLVQKPGFALTTIGILALGIGGTTLVFSLIESILLRPISLPDSERLAMVWLDNRASGIAEDVTSYPNFSAWRESKAFANMACFTPWHPSLTGVEEPDYRIRGTVVSEDFFKVAGVAPKLGRSFLPEEFIPGQDNVVVLGHGLWKRHFGGDEDILGKTVTLSDQDLQVVGVMPTEFNFPENSLLWTPLGMSENAKNFRKSLWLNVIGRLNDGISLEAAQVDLDNIALRLGEEYPDTNRDQGVRIVSLHDQLTRDVRFVFGVLSTAVALVLLIASANVANLFLVRGAAREREFSIRFALGADRWCLMRQQLVENVLFALLGGGLGAFGAFWGVKLLRGLEGHGLPRSDEIAVHGMSLLFALVVSVLTGVILGIVPGQGILRSNLASLLRSGGNTGRSASSGQFLAFLATLEVALSFVVLVGAMLLLGSFQRLMDVDLGFDPENLLTIELSLTRERYPDGEAVRAFYEDALTRLAQINGVEEVGATSAIMLGDSPPSTNVAFEGMPPFDRSEPEIAYMTVSSGFFEALEIPLLKGEALPEVPPKSWVVVVNEALADRYWPSESPVGKRLKLGGEDSQQPWMTIVGVVDNVRRYGLDSEARPENFLDHAQNPRRRMVMVMRTSRDPLALAEVVQQTVAEVNGEMPAMRIRSMDQIVEGSVAQRRFAMLALFLMSTAALLLSCLGVYGVVSYWVRRNLRGIGIRIAVGADRQDVLKLVGREAAWMIGLGLLLGMVLAVMATRWLESLLFGISPREPALFLLVSSFLAFVGGLACFLPAYRATKVNPLDVLRTE